MEASGRPLTAFERDCLFAALMAILSQSYSLAMAAILACNGNGLELPFFPASTTDVTLAGLRQGFAEIPDIRTLPTSLQRVPAVVDLDPG